MPIHDWKRADVGLYHHFHQQWTGELCDGLNAGVLPNGYFALIDQRAVGLVPDVLALGRPARGQDADSDRGGVAVQAVPPKVRHVSHVSDAAVYAARANRVAVRNSFGELVAVVEIVSPGNKDSRHAIRSFKEKAVEFLAAGIHLLIIDLFPPTPRDPAGIHTAIWDEVREEPFDLPPDKRLTLAAYVGEPSMTAYVEPVGVGDPLPAMPLFLDARTYVPAPLEETYSRTWEKCPREMREMVENPPS